MTDHTQRIDRAIRVTPREDRSRYAAEWRHDLAEAQAHGIPPRDVERGAWRLAVDLRTRHVGRLLLGGRGWRRAAGAWLALLGGLVVAGLLLPLGAVITVLVLLGLVVILARAGTPSHWSHWLMVVSIVTGVASGGFVWWAAGVKIDAADAMTPEPAAAAWGGAALVLFALSALMLVASAVVSATRERRVQR